AREANVTAVQDAAGEIGAERVELPEGTFESPPPQMPPKVTAEPPKAEADPLANIDPSDREVLAHAETILRDKPNGTFSEKLRVVIDDIRQSSGIGEELHRIAAACGWRG